MTSAEARAKLVSSLLLWANKMGMHSYLWDELGAFAAAVQEEAFEEMRAEAERRFEQNAAEPGFGPSAQAIAYGRLADWAKQQAKKASGR